MQPGGKSRVTTECPNFAVKLEESLLRQIFGLCDITNHAKTKGVNAPLVERVEVGERVVIAGLGPGKDLCIGRELWSGGNRVGCRIAKLDRTLLFHTGLGCRSFRRRLLKPGTWHALPLGRYIGSSKNRLM